MRENGVSRARLAEMLGVSPSTVRRILDDGETSEWTVRRVHAVTGIPYGALLGEEERHGQG